MNRRELITGLVSLVAAPAIVRAGSLMPVRQVLEPFPEWPPQTFIDELIANAEKDPRWYRTIVFEIPNWSLNGDGYGPLSGEPMHLREGGTM